MTDKDLYNKQISVSLYEKKRLNTLVGVNKDATLKLGKAGYSFMKNLVKTAKTMDLKKKLSELVTKTLQNHVSFLRCSVKGFLQYNRL